MGDTVHPAIKGIVDLLPTPGGVLSADHRTRIIRALGDIFHLVYNDRDTGGTEPPASGNPSSGATGTTGDKIPHTTRKGQAAMTEAEKEKVLEGLGMVRAGVGFVSHPNVQADDKKRIDAAIALIKAQAGELKESRRAFLEKFDAEAHEQIMLQWDGWRKYIRDGGGGSWPRDAFESVIDSFFEKTSACEATIAERDAEIERLKAAIQKARNDLNVPGHLGGQTPNYVAIDLSNALSPTPPQEPEKG